MAEILVRVVAVPFGDPVTGVWCPDCLLPSAVRQAYRGVVGLSVLMAGSGTFCEDCGRRWWTDDPLPGPT